ncbi:ATP-binding cassette domain-containing protein [Candidatus Pelagibacter sp. HIMB1542]|uniref:ATP-binding cassette domain-containing protein n=1 Tax=Candidatus Pelagibacter sp. HIMB1542 TaxID=3413346 RepID=UPI003F850922
MKKIYNQINFILNQNEKIFFIFFILILILALIFQLIGLTTLLPLTNSFLKIDNSGMIFDFFEKYRSATDMDEMYFYLTITFVMIVISNLIFLTSTFISTKFAINIEQNVRYHLMNEFMRSDYTSFLKTDASTLISSIVNETQRFSSQVLMPIGEITSRGFLIISISIFLIIYEPVSTISILLIIFTSYIIYYLSLKNRIKENNIILTKSNKELLKYSNDIFSSFREIKIYGLEKFFVSSFFKSVEKISSIRFFTIFFSSTPRFVMEILVFACIFIYFLFFSQNDNINFGYLSLLLYSFFKIIPSLQGLFSNYISLKSSLHSLSTIYEFLKKSNYKAKLKKTEFVSNNKFKKISIKNLNFSFDDKVIFEDTELEISKGEKVAILGPSGSGKSTLINLLIGILSPKAGKVILNGEEIQSNLQLNFFLKDIVSIIPQKTVLMESTLKENIILNKDYNEEKFQRILKLAKLDELIKNLPEKEQTHIHSSNLNLSGGQIQRISIARALYREPKILIVDEGFNQLDSNTEQVLLNNIFDFRDLTVLIIYHKITNDELIDKKFLLENNKIKLL